ANQFDQVHVARWIEEVHAQKVLAKIFRASVGKLMKRNAAGVRGDDGTLAAMLFHLFEQVALDVEILDDRLDDKIAVFELGKMVFEVSDDNERGKIRSVESRGL